MDEKTQIWSQYADLRQDLRQTNALNVQILGFLIGGAALILTTAFKETDPVARSFIFLATYVVTFPGYQLLQGNRRHIWRLATYIRLFLEPNLAHVSWETDVAELGIQRRSPKRLSLSSLVTVNEWSIITLINAVATMACILLGIRQNQYFTTAQIRWFTVGACLLFLLVSIITGWQALALQRGGSTEEQFFKSWLGVKVGYEETDTASSETA